MCFLSDVIANSFNPKSIPTTADVDEYCGISISVQHTLTKYLPLGFCDIVVLRIRPSICFDTLHLTNPSLGSLILLLNTRMFPLVYLVL